MFLRARVVFDGNLKVVKWAVLRKECGREGVGTGVHNTWESRYTFTCFEFLTQQLDCRSHLWDVPCLPCYLALLKSISRKSEIMHRTFSNQKRMTSQVVFRRSIVFAGQLNLFLSKKKIFQKPRSSSSWDFRSHFDRIRRIGLSHPRIRPGAWRNLCLHTYMCQQTWAEFASSTFPYCRFKS